MHYVYNRCVCIYVYTFEHLALIYTLNLFVRVNTFFFKFDLIGNLGGCICRTSTTTYYNTNKFVRIITFSSYCSHTNILFKHLNVLPVKKLRFLRIGLQRFKYEYYQLPDALNIVLLRIDLCINTILETRTKSALILLSMHTETETFDLLVSMFGIIYVTI